MSLQFSRTCPECNVVIPYQTAKGIAIANALNTRCCICASKNPEKRELITRCFKCGKEKHFNDKRTWWAYMQKHTTPESMLCISCYQISNKETNTSITHLFDREQKLCANWSCKIKERDVNMCQSCGVKASETIILHAHHIMPARSHPFLSLELCNGITLCDYCHQSENGVHGGGDPDNATIRDLRQKLIA